MPVQKGIAKLTLRRGSSHRPVAVKRHCPVLGRKGGLLQRPIVARCHQVAAQVEEVRDSGVDADESLRLKYGFRPPHSPLPVPGLLMRPLGPVVGVPRSHAL